MLISHSAACGSLMADMHPQDVDQPFAISSLTWKILLRLLHENVTTLYLPVIVTLRGAGNRPPPACLGPYSGLLRLEQGLLMLAVVTGTREKNLMSYYYYLSD